MLVSAGVLVDLTEELSCISLSVQSLRPPEVPFLCITI